MDKKKLKQIRKALQDASVPKMYWDYVLPDFKDVGIHLREYLSSDAYLKDVDIGVGIFFYGPGKDKEKIFHTFAKELVLLEKSVVVVSLRRLVNITSENENIWPGVALVGRCDALFITGFYEEDRFSYTHGEISQIEDILREKIEWGLGQVYVSSCKRLQECEWWSKTFRQVFQERTREQAIGKGNRDTTTVRSKKNRKL